jgi:hypothetical protein
MEIKAVAEVLFSSAKCHNEELRHVKRHGNRQALALWRKHALKYHACAIINASYALSSSSNIKLLNEVMNQRHGGDLDEHLSDQLVT